MDESFKDKTVLSVLSLQTVRIHMNAQETKADLGSASGFFCKYKNSISLVTNLHVVSGENPKSGKAIHSSRAVPGSLYVVYNAYVNKYGVVGEKVLEIELYRDGTPIWTMHPKFENRVDVIAIHLITEQVVAGGVKAYDIEEHLEKKPNIRVMDPVFTVGYPLDRKTAGNSYPIYKAGTIASEPEFQDEVPRFYVDGKTKKGMSGSPVLHEGGIKLIQDGGSLFINNRELSLIGVYSGRDRQENSEFEAELGIVWPIKSCLIPILEVIEHDC